MDGKDTTSPEVAGLAYEVGIEMARIDAVRKRERMLCEKYPEPGDDRRYAFHAFEGFPGWWAFLRDVAVLLCAAKDRTEAEIEAGTRTEWMDLWSAMERAADIIALRFTVTEHFTAEEVAAEAVADELGEDYPGMWAIEGTMGDEED